MTGQEMPKMEGLSIAGTVYVKEADCRANVEWALQNGRQPIIDQLVSVLAALVKDCRFRYEHKLKGSKNAAGEIPHQSDREALAWMLYLLDHGEDALRAAGEKTK